MNKNKALTNAEATAIIYNTYLNSPDSKIMNIWEFLDMRFSEFEIQADNYEAV